MTPAIKILKRANITYSLHEYSHDNSNESYGLEASEKMGVAENRVFKTIVIKLDNKEFAVGIIPVSSMLSMKLIAKALKVKKANMATPDDVQRSTGYVLGGVSPLGQKKKLKTIIDSTAQSLTSIYVSAGRRGLEIELHPDDLKKITNATFVDICQ